MLMQLKMYRLSNSKASVNIFSKIFVTLFILQSFQAQGRALEKGTENQQ